MGKITGDRIKQRRIELGYSQERLAEILGIDRTTIAKWESGNSNLKQSKIKEISEVLKCSPVWLIGLEDVKIDIESEMDSMDEAMLKRVKAYAEYLIIKRGY